MKTGGSAFPRKMKDADGIFDYPGMTLRDYFAAKAMQGMKANGDFAGQAEELAERAYLIADAMLAERGK